MAKVSKKAKPAKKAGAKKGGAKKHPKHKGNGIKDKP